MAPAEDMFTLKKGFDTVLGTPFSQALPVYM